MPTVTALELVNRVRRRSRWGDVADVTDTQSAAIMDFLNGAVSDVLGEKRWQFDIRHDGSLVTIPSLEMTGITMIQNSTFGSSASMHEHVTPAVGSQRFHFTGSQIARYEYTGDATASKQTANARLEGTVWGMAAMTDSGGYGIWAMDGNWPGGSTTTATGTAFVAEYLLPDTVKAVLSVRHQGTPLDLDQIDPAASWDEAVPRLSDHYSDSPQWVGVGGYDLNTYSQLNSGDVYAQAEPRLRMIVYPVPQSSYRLDFTYYYQHPQLTDKDSVLEGVPEDIIADIVRMAHTDSAQTLEREVRDGLMMEASVRSSLMRKHAAHDAQPARRRPVTSWNSGTSGRVNVNKGFPGRTIDGPS